jgi:hypothetical protein
MEGQKPCFVGKRYYVDKDSYWGTFWRSLYGEKQDVIGNTIMQSICTNAVQSYESNKTNKKFESQLLEKIINARKGLDRIKRTYESCGKITTSNSIGNYMLILDGVIPEKIKISEGFIKSPNIFTDSTEIQYIEFNDPNRRSSDEGES